MEQGTVRKIRLYDFDRIIELERKCFCKYLAYTPKQLEYLITRANSTCLTETLQDILRGFIIILYRNGSRVAGIETLNVDPLFQGGGIGTKLLNAAEKDMKYKWIKRIRLEVSIENKPAIRLYERAGFKKIKILKNYYNYEHNGTRDAYRMIKDLPT
jgi:ribosomal protein S18 acetylase RimI-like enzyme